MRVLHTTGLFSHEGLARIRFVQVKVLHTTGEGLAHNRFVQVKVLHTRAWLCHAPKHKGRGLSRECVWQSTCMLLAHASAD